MLLLVALVLRLREGGLMAGGPPCGSFIYLNRATSKRSKLRPMGRTSCGSVKNANLNRG